MQVEGQQVIADDVITLQDIRRFSKRNWELFATWGFVGLLLSAAYLGVTPKKYEARWQIQMAQYVNSNSNSNSNSEEPAALIQRLRTPTAYPLEVRHSCGMPEDGEFGDYLGGTLKAVAVKNVANAVEMTIGLSSPDQARKCAEAIVAMIVAQQRNLIEDRLAGHPQQLTGYQQALLKEQQQLEKIKNSEFSNFGYLAKLDKLSWLRTRIDALQEEALLSQMHPAKLVAPIYVPNKPVPSKMGAVLLLGMLAGLMSGVLHALVRNRWRRVA
jgi:hypothetical protein